MPSPKHKEALDKLRIKPQQAQLIAEQLAATAKNAGVLLDAVAEYLGVTTVAFHYWRKGTVTPRRGDVHLMSWLVGVIDFMASEDRFVSRVENRHERIRINTSKFVEELERQNVI